MSQGETRDQETRGFELHVAFGQMSREPYGWQKVFQAEYVRQYIDPTEGLTLVLQADTACGLGRLSGRVLAGGWRTSIKDVWARAVVLRALLHTEQDDLVRSSPAAEVKQEDTADVG